eukprot:2426737-Amphidinium_carterae.1
MQIDLGCGPFYCMGSTYFEFKAKEHMTDDWITNNLTPNAGRAAREYLQIVKEWNQTSIQGCPTAPLGVKEADYAPNERYKMFINDTGLVPTLMPWATQKAIEWMQLHPCTQNFVGLLEGDVTDSFGRMLKKGHIDFMFYYTVNG